jgi:hypothetical protein
MIPLLAFRNLIYRPWRSVLMFFGYAVGVAVMIALLSVGEALITQARDERLVGGGQITVLPQGIDVEVMKTGGVGGLYFSIDHSRFIYRQLLASRRFESVVTGVAPEISARIMYMITGPGQEWTVSAAGEIPSRMQKVHAAVPIKFGTWTDDEGDHRFIAPTLAELRHEIDHFHLPPDSVQHPESWAEWHYFNVVSADRKRWAFISFILGGDVRGDKWGGNITITLREEGKSLRRFMANFPRESVRFSLTDANLRFGESSVNVQPDGNYAVNAVAHEVNTGAPIHVSLVVTPQAGAYFPPISFASGGFTSGYVVPGMRASATGKICVATDCEEFNGAQSYHDHNWGVWQQVTWDWGASRAGPYTILYGRVVGPGSQGGSTPFLVYFVDSLGFRAVFRPLNITYVDGREITVDGQKIRVPARAEFSDAHGSDSLHVVLDIEDAIGTDTRKNPQALSSVAKPYFIQMKGTARIAGRVGGAPVAGAGTGFFETYR